MTDYEALGKYTEGRETLKQQIENRTRLLKKLDTLMSVARLSNFFDAVTRFDVIQAQELLDSLTELEAQITATIAEINTNAENCNKEPVTKMAPNINL